MSKGDLTGIRLCMSDVVMRIQTELSQIRDKQSLAQVHVGDEETLVVLKMASALLR